MLILGSISGSSAHETLTIFHQKENTLEAATKLVMHLLLFKKKKKDFVAAELRTAASRGRPAPAKPVSRS